MIQKFHSRLLFELNAFKDPIRAEGQQRYMKSQMPYFGIKTPEVKKITNQLAGFYANILNQILTVLRVL